MKRLLITLTSAFVMLAISAGAAQAATARPDFTGQARTAGLTAAQATELQERADSYLARLGGRQVSINEIEFTGGATLVLTLPGQDRTGTINASGTVTPLVSCPYLYFCAYSGTNYTDDVFLLYNCGWDTRPWDTTGSWINNQTAGTRARFYNSNNGLVLATAAAYSADSSYNWTPVERIRPC